MQLLHQRGLLKDPRAEKQHCRSPCLALSNNWHSKGIGQLLAYVAAMVFYTDPRLPRPTDAVLASDILLVAANCVCFVFLLSVLLRTAAKRTTDLQLRFDGEQMTLRPPHAGQYHLFLSHVNLS